MEIKDFIGPFDFSTPEPVKIVDVNGEKIKIPIIEKEEVAQELRECEELAGMSLEAFRKAIRNRELERYNYPDLGRWKRLVRVLERLEQGEVLSWDEASDEIFDYTLEELMQDIHICEVDFGMTVEEVLQGIADGTITHYSAGQVSMWASNVRRLKEWLKDE